MTDRRTEKKTEGRQRRDESRFRWRRKARQWRHTATTSGAKHEWNENNDTWKRTINHLTFHLTVWPWRWPSAQKTNFTLWHIRSLSVSARTGVRLRRYLRSTHNMGEVRSFEPGYAHAIYLSTQDYIYLVVFDGFIEHHAPYWMLSWAYGNRDCDVQKYKFYFLFKIKFPTIQKL